MPPSDPVSANAEVLRWLARQTKDNKLYNLHLCILIPIIKTQSLSIFYSDLNCKWPLELGSQLSYFKYQIAKENLKTPIYILKASY